MIIDVSGFDGWDLGVRVSWEFHMTTQRYGIFGKQYITKTVPVHTK